MLLIAKQIHSYLTDRTATIKLKNHFYDSYNFYSGSPQSAIILPTLSLFLLSDFPLPTNQHILVFMLTDDIAIWYISESLHNIFMWLQPYFDVFAL